MQPWECNGVINISGVTVRPGDAIVGDAIVGRVGEAAMSFQSGGCREGHEEQKKGWYVELRQASNPVSLDRWHSMPPFQGSKH